MKYIYIFIAILIGSCAQINVLTGGPKDEFAPQIDSVKSFPHNGEINYSGDLIKLKFDEYISLVKPADNIIITPRPAVNPTYTSHNKTLEIIFNQPLLESTTYTINFNNAVADITEKNDSVFQYVFSTGNYIDSLSIQGRVSDGFTNKASASFLVALYPKIDSVSFDSIPYSIKPTYITQTDQGGNFKLNYLKEGSYFIFAMNDKNKNLLLDADEEIAFLTQQGIDINAQAKPIELKSFKPTSGLCTVKRVNFSSPGKIEIILSATPETFFISSSCQLLPEATGVSDSLIFWLADSPKPKMRFAIELNGVADTLKPMYRSNTDGSTELKFTTNAENGKLNPGIPLKIQFSEPVNLESIDLSKVHLMKFDSTFVPLELFQLDIRTYELRSTHNEPLTFIVDSSAVQSIYGVSNASKKTIPFENFPLTHFGSLIVNTDTVFPVPAIVYLINSKGEKVDTATFTSSFKFQQVLPGDYQICVVLDANEDGVWTSGSLPFNQVPEKVIYFNQTVEVKSKWEKEVDWILNIREN